MELKFAHLADYATTGDKGKLVIIGIFDLIGAGSQRPIVPPPFYLVGSFRAYLTEGTEHELEIRLVNADGADVIRGSMHLRFVPTGQQTVEANFVAGMLGLSLPEEGDYAFHLLVDHQHKGIVSFRVIPAPGQ